jgi:7-cyano-7-deazaguanine reductase
MKKRSSGNSAEGLTQLGSGETGGAESPEDARLEAFSNPHPERDYEIEFDCPEFTSLCPITGQPDFGVIHVHYVPDQHCVESKSLKLYLFSFRNYGSFGEAIVNRILDDLVAACHPRRMKVTGSFSPRGGIGIKVSASYPA